MDVFGSSLSINVWGPTASTVVNVSVLGSEINDKCVLMNASINARELVDIRQCFNDVSYIYALGNDMRQCSLTLTLAISIGSCVSTGSGGGFKIIKNLFSAYASNRISEKPKKTKVTLGGFSCNGWLTGLDVGNFDLNRGMCIGTAHFIIELPGGN